MVAGMAQACQGLFSVQISCTCDFRSWAKKAFLNPDQSVNLDGLKTFFSASDRIPQVLPVVQEAEAGSQLREGKLHWPDARAVPASG